MARPPISLVENQNPQVDEEDLLAEVELEAPGTLDMSGLPEDIDIEMDDEGGALIDFEAGVIEPSGDFYGTLAGSSEVYIQNGDAHWRDPSNVEGGLNFPCGDGDIGLSDLSIVSWEIK